MKEYNRKYPLFALCGLSCGLCPNYHSDASFQCPGCGGKDFYQKHPTCAIVSCSERHGNIEFCYLCSEYPCERYAWQKNEEIYDSFIAYRNVEKDIEKIKEMGIETFYKEIEEKVAALEYLLENYNSGRQKSFFCIAVNLLELSDTENAILEIKKSTTEKQTLKEKSKIAVDVFQKLAGEQNITLKLNKKK